MAGARKSGWMVVAIIGAYLAAALIGPTAWALAFLVSLVAAAVALGMWLYHAIAGATHSQPLPISPNTSDEVVIDAWVVDQSAEERVAEATEALYSQWEHLKTERRAFEAEKAEFARRKRQEGDAPSTGASLPVIVPTPSSKRRYSHFTESAWYATAVGVVALGLAALAGILPGVVGVAGKRAVAERSPPSVAQDEDPHVVLPPVKARDLPVVDTAPTKPVERGRDGTGPGPKATSAQPTANPAVVRSPEVEALVNEGAKLANDRQLDAAVERLNEAIRLAPEKAEAYGYRSTVLAKQGKFGQAISDARHGVKLAPLDASQHFFLGYVLFMKGDSRTAIVSLTRAIELRPTFRDAYQYRADAYNAVGERANAEADAIQVEALPSR